MNHEIYINLKLVGTFYTVWVGSVGTFDTVWVGRSFLDQLQLLHLRGVNFPNKYIINIFKWEPHS